MNAHFLAPKWLVSRNAIVAAVFAGALSACGGGGGGQGTATTNAGASSTASNTTSSGSTSGSGSQSAVGNAAGFYLLPFISPNDGSIGKGVATLVDPAAPSLSGKLADVTEGSVVDSLIGGTVDAVAGTLTDPYQRYVYFVSGDSLKRLDLKKTGQTPAPLTIAVPAVSSFCSDTLSIESQDETSDAAIAFAQLKPGGCGANTGYVAIPIASNGTPGAQVALPGKPLRAIVNASGARVGTLVQTGTALLRLDAAFANPTTIMTISSDFEIVKDVGATAPGYVLVRNANQIRAINLTTNAVSIGLLALAAFETVSAATGFGDTAVLSVYNGSVSKLYRITVPALGTPVLLAQENGRIAAEFLTPTRLVYSLAGRGGYKSVPLSGGTPITVVDDTALPVGVINVCNSAGENLFCQTVKEPFDGSLVPDVTIVRADGSNRQTLSRTAIVATLSTLPGIPLRLDSDDAYFVLASNLGSGLSLFAGTSLTTYKGSDRSVQATGGSFAASQTGDCTVNFSISLPSVIGCTTPTGGISSRTDYYLLGKGTLTRLQ